MEPMTLINIKIPRDLREALRAESDRTGAPVAELLRRAAWEYLGARGVEPIEPARRRKEAVTP
jgi:hypothetical protein